MGFCWQSLKRVSSSTDLNDISNDSNEFFCNTLLQPLIFPHLLKSALLKARGLDSQGIKFEHLHDMSLGDMRRRTGGLRRVSEMTLGCKECRVCFEGLSKLEVMREASCLSTYAVYPVQTRRQHLTSHGK